MIGNHQKSFKIINKSSQITKTHRKSSTNHRKINSNIEIQKKHRNEKNTKHREFGKKIIEDHKENRNL